MTQLADISRSLRLSVAITALFVLAGCGIKGPLELPTDAQVKASDAKGKGEYPGERRLPGYDPTVQQRKEAKQMGQPVKPDNPFFLDPLLK